MAASFVSTLLVSQLPGIEASKVMKSVVMTGSDWKLPSNSWDTHVHVFEPATYSLSPFRAYTPETASFASLLRFEAELSANGQPPNLVLVQASPYGTDNSLNLDILKQHKERACSSSKMLRAIVVFDESQVTDKELHLWNELGVRGFRINNEASATGIDYDALSGKIMDTATRVRSYSHWKCQLYISGASWDHLYPTLSNLPIKIIADHQGGMKGTSALPANVTVTAQPGYKSLVKLAKRGKIYVKISGLYRSSELTSSGYDDLEPLIKALASEVPDQLIWASDWPHTGAGANRTEANKFTPEPFRPVDDAAVLKNVRAWVGSDLWQKMTVHTPTVVYE